MRPLVIVNPRSGVGHAPRFLGEVRDVIEHRLGQIDLELTRRPGHAIDLAREATQEGRTLVVAAGGDGTLHEAANGILDAGGNATLAFVGLGTGGDFRRSLGIGHRLDSYVQAIVDERDAMVDVGRVRYRAPDGATGARWFVNVLSVGVGGLVDRYIAHTKLFGPRAGYFAASALALAACDRGRLRCEAVLDDHRSELRIATYMLAVCNGRYFGGGMHVAPMAKPHDGRFEVVSIDAPSKVAFAAWSRRIYDAAHLRAPGFRHFGCQRLSLELENARAASTFLLDVDGEPLGGLPVEVALVPAALRVRVGPAFGLDVLVESSHTSSRVPLERRQS